MFELLLSRLLARVLFLEVHVFRWETMGVSEYALGDTKRHTIDAAASAVH